VTDRRRFLLGAGATALSAGLGACSDGDPVGSSDGGLTSSPSTTAPVTAAVGAAIVALTDADFDGLAVCRLLPEQTAGPFPLDEQFERRDVSEGRPGHPLRLGLRVVDAACEPVPGALVEIWHADPRGDYSAFRDGGDGKDEGEGMMFLRGTQRAGADGIVASIYPGWYRGRAVHVHLRVHRPDEPGSLLLTSQLYFPDDHTAAVLREEPYAEFGPPDTTDAEDPIAGHPEREGTLLTVRSAVTPNGPGTLALANVGVGLR